jgi:AcrR family transcriptional regulator
MDSDPNMSRDAMSILALRERGKARRYADIVAAAAVLWRDKGFENVSLSQIAAAAEVAPQTIYNLVGGLDAVAWAVIKQALDRLDAALATTSASGLDLALEAGRIMSELYVADPKLYRQLLARIPRVLFQGVHLGRDVAQIIILAMVSARDAGQIAPELDPELLGRAVYAAYLGALYEWASGDSDDAAFVRAAEIAVLAPLAACATDALRPALTARLFRRLRVGDLDSR